MSDTLDQYMTQAEAAEALNRTRQTLWAWRKEGKGPKAVRMQREWLYCRSSVQEYAEELQKDDEHG